MVDSTPDEHARPALPGDDASCDDESKAERRTRWMRWFSLWRTVAWLLLVVPAYLLGWLESVTFVSLLSLWALVETAFAAWRSDETPDTDRMMRIEQKLDELLRERDSREDEGSSRASALA